MATHVSHVRNVNEAFQELMRLSGNPALWRKVSPRGMETLEFRGLFITEYSHPHERVLFSAVRDANPFFHFMEALWIMAGRDDVAFLNQFNSNISTFSDDGITFNAPYGYRLRRHFTRTVADHMEDSGYACKPVDQIAEIISLLQHEPATRRAVLCLWDPVKDLNRESRDIPCNDLVMFSIRDGYLDMTVTNRSNDAMWGAYGANAVQFSMLQELVACACAVNIGSYRQVSNLLHVYTSQATWQRCKMEFEDNGFSTDLICNPYIDNMGRTQLTHYRLYEAGTQNNWWRLWLKQNEMFLNGDMHPEADPDIMPFFTDVAEPIWKAWRAYKDHTVSSKNKRIDEAQLILNRCQSDDWRLACVAWLQRRRQDPNERIDIRTMEPWGKDRT